MNWAIAKAPLSSPGMASGAIVGTSGIYMDKRCTLGGTNTFGAWVQMNAALPFDCIGFYLQIDCGLGTNVPHIIQVGIGAAASEFAIFSAAGCSASFYSAQSAALGLKTLFVPLQLRKGQRIACRAQGSSSSTSTAIGVNFIGVPVSPFMPLGFYGVESINTPSTATSLTPLSTVSSDNGADPPVGTKLELTAACTNALRAFVLEFQGDGTLANMLNNFAVRLYLGASAGVDVFGALTVQGSVRNVPDMVFGPIPCDIPAGTRIQIEVIGAGGAPVVRPIFHGFY